LLFHAGFNTHIREHVLGPDDELRVHEAVIGALSPEPHERFSVYALQHLLAHDREAAHCAARARVKPAQSPLSRLTTRLQEWVFLVEALEAGLLNDVRRELRATLQSGLPGGPSRTLVSAWLGFLDRGHHLFRGDRRRLFAMAMAEAADSPVRQAAAGASLGYRGPYLDVPPTTKPESGIRPYLVLAGHHGKIQWVRYASESPHVISCDRREIRVWDVTTGEVVQSITIATEEITAFEIAADRLLVCTREGELQVLSMPDLAIVRSCRFSEGRYGLDVSAFGNLARDSAGAVNIMTGTELVVFDPLPQEGPGEFSGGFFWYITTDHDEFTLTIHNRLLRMVLQYDTREEGEDVGPDGIDEGSEATIFIEQMKELLAEWDWPETEVLLDEYVSSIRPHGLGFGWWVLAGGDLIDMAPWGMNAKSPLGSEWLESFGMHLATCPPMSKQEWVLTWGEEGMLLVKATTGEERVRIPYTRIRDAALAPGGQYAAVARDDYVTLWNLSDDSSRENPTVSFTRLRASRTRDLLAVQRVSVPNGEAAGCDIYDVVQGELLHRFRSESGRVRGVFTDEQGPKIIVEHPGQRAVVKLTESDGTVAAELAIRKNEYDSPVLLADPRDGRLLIGRETGLYWKSWSGEQRRMARGDFSSATAFAGSDGGFVVVRAEGPATRGYVIHVFSADGSSSRLECPDTVWSACHTEAGLWTGHLSGAIRYWTQDGEAETRVPGSGEFRESGVSGLSLSPDLQMIAVGAINGQLSIFRTVDMEQVAWFDFQSRVNDCLFLTNDVLAVATNDQFISTRLIVE
jgi:WD40 repeat protein